MPILIVAVGVLIMLFLIIKVKLNTFVSLIVVSFLVAIGLGMDINKIVLSIETGIGGLTGAFSFSVWTWRDAWEACL